jgi:ligand-binding sensor protein
MEEISLLYNNKKFCLKMRPETKTSERIERTERNNAHQEAERGHYANISMFYAKRPDV